jgi:hypothetical protein
MINTHVNNNDIILLWLFLKLDMSFFFLYAEEGVELMAEKDAGTGARSNECIPVPVPVHSRQNEVFFLVCLA